MHFAVIGTIIDTDEGRDPIINHTVVIPEIADEDIYTDEKIQEYYDYYDLVTFVPVFRLPLFWMIAKGANAGFTPLPRPSVN